MSKKCLTCKDPEIFHSFEEDTEKMIPLWYKKIGNYSLLPPFLNKNEKYNALVNELQEEIPKITGQRLEVSLDLTKEMNNTWIFYWASESKEKEQKVIKSAQEAYDTHLNRGLLKTDDQGKITMILNCPQKYKVLETSYPSHIHFTHLQKGEPLNDKEKEETGEIENVENVWSSDVKIVVVKCEETSQSDNYITEKIVFDNEIYTHIMDGDETISITHDKDKSEYTLSDDAMKLTRVTKNKESEDEESSDKESSDEESSDKESEDEESSDKESEDEESSDKESSDKESSDEESSESDMEDSEKEDLFNKLSEKDNRFYKKPSSTVSEILKTIKQEKIQPLTLNLSELQLPSLKFNEKKITHHGGFGFTFY